MEQWSSVSTAHLHLALNHNAMKTLCDRCGGKGCRYSHNNHILSHLCYSSTHWEKNSSVQLFLKALIFPSVFTMQCMFTYLNISVYHFKSLRVKVNTKVHVSHLHLVTTPSSRMMLGWSNWPMMLASLRKSRLCLSVYPALRVFMATQISRFPGILRRPLHTSPNSPLKRKNQAWIKNVCGT